VLLLIASQYTFQFIKRSKQEDFDQAEYDRVRAQAIVNNVPPQFEDVSPEELQKEIDDEEDSLKAELEQEIDSFLPNDEIDKAIDEEIKKIDEEITNEVLSVVEEYNVPTPVEPPPSNMGIVLEAKPQMRIDTVPEKKTEEIRLTEEQINELDQHPEWSEAKRKWKDENPNLTIKAFKEKYLLGEIDSFPWETYLDKEDSSDSIKTTVDSGYIQNEEQTDETAWRRVRDKDE
jgi:hypothetical protein